MTKQSLTGLALCLCLVWAAPARADVVTDWNAHTVLYVALGNSAAVPAIPVGRAGPPGLLDIALVQVAVHDAVQAIEGRYEPYYYSDPSKFGIGSVEAAVAAAAHRALVLLYPGQQGSLDSLYNSYLVAHGLVGNPGLATGEAAAVAVHSTQYRPLIVFPDFFGNNAPGQWRSAVPMAFYFLAFSEPFTLNRVSQFRPPPPPPMQSTVYAREFDDVKAKGNVNAHPNSTTDLARFYSGNFPVQYNESMRQISNAHALNVGDAARLFALANLAASDGAMAAWESKIFYNFWRPSHAIQNAAADGNPRTAPDAAWTPFLANPAYPDYVSGANTLTGAFMETLTLFFGTDEMNFSVKNPNPAVIMKERFYTRFSQVSDDVVEARILLGIHFRSADEEARRLGSRVAHWTFQKFLRPVPGK